ncbi:MAG: c-type cytochrome [Vicinamibacterales bacterium]
MSLIVQQRLSRDGWSREIDKMVGWGAVVAGVEREGLLSYLTTHFGASPSPLPGEVVESGAALLNTRCQTCHNLQLVEQQKLDAAGWRRELDKMIGWGAALTDAEKDALIVHLARRGVR